MRFQVRTMWNGRESLFCDIQSLRRFVRRVGKDGTAVRGVFCYPYEGLYHVLLDRSQDLRGGRISPTPGYQAVLESRQYEVTMGFGRKGVHTRDNRRMHA